MENASKALIMAAEVLVGVLIITFGVIMVRAFSNYGAATTASMDDTKRTTFNNQFTKYYDSTTITIHDIITISNLAQENNYLNEYVKKDANGKYVLKDVNDSHPYYINVEIAEKTKLKPLETSQSIKATNLKNLLKNIESLSESEVQQVLKYLSLSATKEADGTIKYDQLYFKVKEIRYDPDTKLVNYVSFEPVKEVYLDLSK
jgi:hypothetical protein